MSERGPILLTGATGQVGGELLTWLAPLGRIVAPTRQQMDLSDPASIREVIRSLRPRWIINPGAYTAVDKAESEPALAFSVNAESVAAIGEEAQRIGAAVVHFSTDYVFSGEGISAYREDDLTGPASVYGASKLAGERALVASGAAHVILRTSWVYGATGKNFLRTILKLARECETLRIVADQHGAPTGSRDLALLTAYLLTHFEASSHAAQASLVNAVHAADGIYHAAGGGETTWFGFAEEALREARLMEPGTRFAALEPISTAEYPTPAKRPANSRLDSSKLAKTFGWTMPPWQETLTSVLGQLRSI